MSYIYHLSKVNHDGEVFYPRVPESAMEDEKSKAKRICFSTSIDGALKALPNVWDFDEYFVHIPEGPISFFKPSVKQVPDCDVTGEVWVKGPIKIKTIGKVKVLECIPGHIDKRPEDRYVFEDGEEDWTDQVHWQFLDFSS